MECFLWGLFGVVIGGVIILILLLLFIEQQLSDASELPDEPEFEDGHDCEGFAGGCERMGCPCLDKFEAWLRTACFQKPTYEAYDLAKLAWKEAMIQAHKENK